MIALQPLKKGRVVDQAIFDNFGITGAQFARRKRIQRGGIRQHQTGLVECTDQVLAMGGIDAGLAADRTVDLRQQRCRHLDKADAPAHRGRHIAGQITNYATAKCNQNITAFQPGADDLFHQRFKNRKALGGLTGIDLEGHRLKTGLLQTGLDPFAIKRRNLTVRDNSSPHPPITLDNFASQAGDQIRADENIIGSCSQLHPHLRRIGLAKFSHDALTLCWPSAARYSSRALRMSPTTTS